MTYTVVFVREEDGRYSVSVPALPGCHTWGRNLPHAFRMVEEACSVTSSPCRRTETRFPQTWTP